MTKQPLFQKVDACKNILWNLSCILNNSKNKVTCICVFPRVRVFRVQNQNVSFDHDHSHSQPTLIDSVWLFCSKHNKYLTLYKSNMWLNKGGSESRTQKWEATCSSLPLSAPASSSSSPFYPFIQFQPLLHVP